MSKRKVEDDQPASLEKKRRIVKSKSLFSTLDRDSISTIFEFCNLKDRRILASLSDYLARIERQSLVHEPQKIHVHASRDPRLTSSINYDNRRTSVILYPGPHFQHEFKWSKNMKRLQVCCDNVQEDFKLNWPPAVRFVFLFHVNNLIPSLPESLNSLTLCGKVSAEVFNACKWPEGLKRLHLSFTPQRFYDSQCIYIPQSVEFLNIYSCYIPFKFIKLPLNLKKLVLKMSPSEFDKLSVFSQFSFKILSHFSTLNMTVLTVSKK